MREVLSELIEILSLERIEENIFRGQSQDLGWGRVFGGQVLGQSLSAAEQTVPADRFIHSLHGYFLRPGDAAKPIVFTVDPIRDGRSFTTRRVVAVQDGRAIFSLSASFQVVEPGVEHQTGVPEVPEPEGLPSELSLIRGMADRIPEPLRKVLTQDRPIDFRPVEPMDPFDPQPRPPVRHFWLRSVGDVPDDRVLHQAVLAYASDYGLLGTALQPHGLTVRAPGLQVASLDHALWFHRPFRVDDWLLYAIDSPAAAGARGFTRGSIYTRDGKLVASVAQEGLMRVRRTDV